MDLMEKGVVSPTHYCEWCLNIGTSRCSRCHVAIYCCREHQVQHWSVHKQVCNKAPPNAMDPSDRGSALLDTFQPYSAWCQNNFACGNTQNRNTVSEPTEAFNGASNVLREEKGLDFPLPNEDEIFSSLSSELLSSDNNFWDVINTCDTQNVFDYGMYLEKDGIMENASETFSTPSTSYESDPASNDHSDYSMQCAPLNDICSNIVHDLNTFGICVLDNFIGSRYGGLILEEVKSLYLRGIFRKGELVNPSPYLSEESVRRDLTTWVEGRERDCRCIGSLIRKLDVVVTTCNKMPKNGLLSQYKLHRRTKAMIACYPGDGTYYKKHIDNPHRDGRCITCIYYLNQNWDVKQHGGLLRMFPSAHESHVANIEPIFDRMLFFWSDKRNPHEVLPSYATRFAITVWYFDADERDQALMASRDRALIKRSKNQKFTI